MSVQTLKCYYTPEEYLSLEEQANYKSEYRDGEIIAMTGGTTNHNEIALNVAANLKFCLRRKNYRVYIGDVRLWIPRYRQYTYPDVMIIEGEPIYSETSTTTVMNPSLIIEVLSKSTRNYDQGDKFLYYRSIPEFREYILIEQTNYHASQYAKNSEGKWFLTEYDSPDNLLKFESIDFQICLQDIYAGVNFDLNDE
jgi:Uma2 family endonuclease